MIRALALFLVAAPAAAQNVGLELEACEATWADAQELARLVRIELRAADRDDVEVASEPPFDVRWRIDGCDLASVALRSIGLPSGERARTIDLSDVEGSARMRTLALALVDLLLAQPPPIRAAPVLAIEPPAPAPPVQSGAMLVFGPAALWVPSLSMGYAGLAALALFRLPLPALRLEVALSLLYSQSSDRLGEVQLGVPLLSFGVELAHAFEPLEIAAVLALRAGISIASARSTSIDVRAESRFDLLLDAVLAARARLRFAEGWYAQLDAGVGFAISGMIVRADERPVAGWSDWIFPFSVGVGFAF